MALTRPIQNSFAAGELSPLMDMRHDLAIRAQGVSIMENFFSHLQGPAETRGGFERTFGVAGASGRMFTFQLTPYIGYIVTITPTLIYISDNNGPMYLNDLMNNGDFLEGPADWTVYTFGSGTVIFTSGSCYITPGPDVGEYAAIRNSIPTTIGQTYEFNVQIGRGEGVMRFSLGSTSGGTDLHDDYYNGSDTITVNVIATASNIFLELNSDGGEPIKLLDAVTAFNLTSGKVQITFASPWPGPSEIADIQEEMTPGDSQMYMVSPTIFPYQLVYDKATRAWTFALVTFISPPASWVNGSTPRALTFFEGRLYLAGTTNEPETFWGSVPGSYTDFTLGSLPSDAISYRLSRRGLIQWMQGASTLVFGTEVGEFIASSQSGIIQPDDISVRQQSANGSRSGPSILIGNNILYVSGDSRKIRSMSFDWNKDAWVSQDITFAAEHMTQEGNFLTHKQWTPNPHSILWGVTAQGTLIGASYSPQSSAASFHRHYTDGRIVSITSKKYAGSDDIWILVDRGQGELSIERYNFAALMDSFTSFHFEVPTILLSGLFHLALKECQVLVDGAVHRDVLVDEFGNATLDYAGIDVFIGLQYIARLLTSPRDDGQPIDGGRMGSARSADKRWAKVYVRLLDSWKPLINGKRPPERTAAAPMNAIQPAATEDIQATLRGWSKEALIDIQQDLPLKTVVIGIYGEVEQGDI